MRKRLEPFLVLLEARYAPLLFAVAPQAYAVFKWLWGGSDMSLEALIFAVMGGVGYEFVYVGAIAWAEEKRFSFWTWITALIALVFSMFVAFYVYSATQGNWAWLHVGFPLVAFAYTMNMYTQSHELSLNTEATALIDRAKQLRADGLSYATIAERLDMSKSTVYKMLTSEES